MGASSVFELIALLDISLHIFFMHKEEKSKSLRQLFVNHTSLLTTNLQTPNYSGYINLTV